jgi:tRNA-intron lyase
MSAELKPKPFELKKKPGTEGLWPAAHVQCTDLRASRCYGTVYGQGVLVTELQHIRTLIRLGCYGKGVFSRSVPSHLHIPARDEVKQFSRKRRAAAAAEDIEFMWKKRMKLHSQWKQEGMSVEGESSTTELLVEYEPSLGQACVDEYQEFVSRLKAIKREDPYPLEEYLQLGAEEAFYLAAEVDILTVNSVEAGPLSKNNLWLHLMQLSKTFCARYAAYSHYRAGNWVPKSGLKFGMDFLLYKESPLCYHSSFAVVVREQQAGANEGGAAHCNLTWKEVIGFNRISESVRKDLLLCYVAWPESSTRIEPSCIMEAKITDTIIKRWVPEKNR